MEATRKPGHMQNYPLGFLSVVGILTSAVCAWCLLSGTAITGAAFMALFVFMGGVTSWASLCRLIWPAKTTVNSYLPMGYGLCSLVSLIFILLKQGTVLSCILASGLGVAAYAYKSRNTSAADGQASRILFPDAITPSSLASLVIASLLASFLMLDQLHSIASLNQAATDTLIKAWSDVILHANTLLSISSLPWGQAPISTLDYAAPIIPYHYISYVLSAFLNSLSPQASPLACFITIVAPLGLLLLLLPLNEQLQDSITKASIGVAALKVSTIFAVYCLWVRLIHDTFLDPVWLLITAPATLYACAMVVSCLDIAFKSETFRAVNVIGLTATAFLLVGLSKLQIAQSLLPMVTLIIVLTLANSNQSLPRIRVKYRVLIPISLGLLVLACLGLNSLVGVARSKPVEEVGIFLQGIRNIAWPLNGNPLSSLLDALWINKILGLLTLCGPLFLLAIGYSLSIGRQQALLRAMLLLMFTSYCLGLFVSPSMPWDDGEFLNRSWPVLWCVGAWVLLGVKNVFSDTRKTRIAMGLSLLLVALGLSVLPLTKQLSIASPRSKLDWSKDYFPVRIKKEDKSIARMLQALGRNSPFFAISSPENNRQILDDSPARLASLSGMRPVMSRLGFQKSLQAKKGVPENENSIGRRYLQMLARYKEDCHQNAHLQSATRIIKGNDNLLEKEILIVCDRM